MLKIGITGQAGFIGKHLYNTISLSKNAFQLIPFEKSFFDNENQLNDFVGQCDVIVHLAAMNRHNDPNVIYETNIILVQKLVKALKLTNSKAHVLFSSSTQEDKDNLYGKSKREGRLSLSTWADNYGGRFTGFIIPNVFGPFGLPNYNSVVATFCYKLSHNETPMIENDGVVKLIYVGELVEQIIAAITNNNPTKDLVEVAPTTEIKVSSILLLLQKFKVEYLDNGVIPILSDTFELNLFNTFRCYMETSRHFPVIFATHDDSSGSFVEIIKTNLGAEVLFSILKPGRSCGNHFHTHKIERVAVIKGEALLQLRQVGTVEILNYHLDGSNPGYVDIPIWYTYNIQNVGYEEIVVIFLTSGLYNSENSDTFFEIL